MKELFDAKLVPLQNGIDSIKSHLKDLNGQVVKNTKFRVQAFAGWAVLGMIFTIANNLSEIKQFLIAML